MILKYTDCFTNILLLENYTRSRDVPIPDRRPCHNVYKSLQIDTYNLGDLRWYLHDFLYPYRHEILEIVPCWIVCLIPGDEINYKINDCIFFLRSLLLMSVLTLCLSMCSLCRWGSNNNLVGSILTGDCRRPLLHIFHCGFIY